MTKLFYFSTLLLFITLAVFSNVDIVDLNAEKIGDYTGHLSCEDRQTFRSTINLSTGATSNQLIIESIDSGEDSEETSFQLAPFLVTLEESNFLGKQKIGDLFDLSITGEVSSSNIAFTLAGTVMNDVLNCRFSGSRSSQFWDAIRKKHYLQLTQSRLASLETQQY